MIEYGFHGWPELYSELVGKAIEKNPPQGVEVLYYRPRTLSDERTFPDLSKKDQRMESHKGRKELRKYLRDNFKGRFVIDLHDTSLPFIDNRDHSFRDEIKPEIGNRPQYVVTYPAWNTSLSVLLHDYARGEQDKGRRFAVLSSFPVDELGYHAVTIEFMPMLINEENEMLYLSKREGVQFTIEFVRVIQRRYLRKEA